MTRLPSITGEQVVRGLGEAGFQVLRRRGSPGYLKHPDGRATVLLVHKAESLGQGLMKKIMQDVELSREEFLKLLR